MKALTKYVSLTIVLILLMACGGISGSGITAPEVTTETGATPDAASNANPTPTTAPQAVPGAFPAESILTFTGDSTPFKNPTGIDMDAEGNIYIADFLNHRVVKFDSNGKALSQGNSFGSGDEDFLPYGIAVDGQGNVFVTDQVGDSVLKFDSDGKLLTEWGSNGPDDGQFFNPEAVAVDAEGNVYIADEQNHRIQKFDSSGKFLSAWGSLGDGDGQFRDIGGITFDQEGNVYVSDGVRISIFDNNGNFLRKWEHINCIYGTYEIKGAGAMWFDSQNRLFMVVFPPSVCVLDQDGKYLGNWGSKGTQTGQFDFPIDLVGDNAGNLYVLEYSNNRIQKFEIK